LLRDATADRDASFTKAKPINSGLISGGKSTEQSQAERPDKSAR